MAEVRVGRRWVGAFILAATLLFAAMATGSRGLLLAGLLLGSVAGWGTRLGRRATVEGHIELAAQAVEADEVPMMVELANRRRRRTWPEVKIRLPVTSSVRKGQDVAFLGLGGRGQTRLDLKVSFGLFGLQRVGPVEMRTADPFGFAAIEETIAPSVDLRVYPKRDALRDQVLKTKQMRALMGRYEVSQPGSGFEFFGLRDYSPGDRPRDVNWKASARMGALIVNQRQRESDAEIVLLVDVRAATALGRPTQSPFAQGSRAALAVGESHLKGRDAVRMVAYGEILHEDRHTGSTRHARGLLELVVGLAPAGHLPLRDVVHHLLPSLKHRSPVMLFSPLLEDASVREAVALLRSHDFPVSVLAPVPAWGPSIPENVQRQCDALQQVEVQALRRMGVPVALHRPGRPLADSLVELEVRG